MSDRRDDESIAEATLIEPRSGPEAEERAYEEAMAEQSEEPVATDANGLAGTPKLNTSAKLLNIWLKSSAGAFGGPWWRVTGCGGLEPATAS